MAPWVWLLSVGGGFVLLLCGAFGARRRRRTRIKHGPLDARHQRVTARSSCFGLDPLRGTDPEPSQEPSAMYLGQLYFFDTAEHRDMFEANQHRPVAMDTLLVTAHGQHGRHVERQRNR